MEYVTIFSKTVVRSFAPSTPSNVKAVNLGEENLDNMGTTFCSAKGGQSFQSWLVGQVIVPGRNEGEPQTYITEDKLKTCQIGPRIQLDCPRLWQCDSAEAHVPNRMGQEMWEEIICK